MLKIAELANKATKVLALHVPWNLLGVPLCPPSTLVPFINQLRAGWADAKVKGNERRPCAGAHSDLSTVASLSLDPTDLSNPAPVQNQREHQLMCRHQGTVPRRRAEPGSA